MSGKVGRPPLEYPRNLKIEVRLNVQEAAILEDCRKRLGRPRSQIMRDGLMQIHAQLEQVNRSTDPEADLRTK